MGIYKNEESKGIVIELYDLQLKKLGCFYKDIFIETSFGKTHVIETGNLEGEPLLVFHGGNSTTAYNLLLCKFLLKDFHVYAVDIIGHPGKSVEMSISSRGYNYGKWASEVIDGIGLSKIKCFGGSFGGGVLAKLICIAPQKVIKAVLVVPSAINNAFPIGSMKIIYPLMKYLYTKDEKYIKETALYMAIDEKVLDEETLAIIKNSFDCVKIKVAMPSNINSNLANGYKKPILVIAGEKDCLFPARKVLKRAKEIFPHCKTYELKERGHMHRMTENEKNMIIDFLKSE